MRPDDWDDNPEWTGANLGEITDSAGQLLAIRSRLDMTQAEFADLIGVPLGTLRNWEQERSEPDAAAETLIRLIFRDPHGMRERLERKDRVPAE